MRRAPFLALVLLAGLSLSCGDAPTAIQDETPAVTGEAAQLSPTLLLAKKANGATVEWRRFSFWVQGCEEGETILVEGFSHNLTKDQERGKSGPNSFLKVSAQGFGVGDPSGAKYVFSDHITYSNAGEGAGGEILRRLQLIGQGRVPNLYFYGVVQFTPYDDGDVTIELDQAHEICK